jgi:hypothetical protein
MSGDEPTGQRWRRYRGKRALARLKASMREASSGDPKVRIRTPRHRTPNAQSTIVEDP